MAGYIKLHRDIKKWQWYDSPAHYIIFTKLLLGANYKTTVYRNITVNAGQIITGTRQLAQWSGYSPSTVQRVLNDLISSNEIARETSNKYSIITIVNWDKYQGGGTQTDTPSSTQSSTQMAPSKKLKKEKNIYIPIPEIIDALNNITGKSFKYTTKKTRELIKARFSEGYSLDDFKTVIDNKYQSFLDGRFSHEYLRPETLFGNKFESYLNEVSSRSALEKNIKQDSRDFLESFGVLSKQKEIK